MDSVEVNIDAQQQHHQNSSSQSEHPSTEHHQYHQERPDSYQNSQSNQYNDPSTSAIGEYHNNNNNIHNENNNNNNESYNNINAQSTGNTPEAVVNEPQPLSAADKRLLKLTNCLNKVNNAIPVVVVLGMAGYCYYAFVVVLSLNAVSSVAQRVLYLIFFHILYIMFFWSYGVIVFSSPKRPSEFYSIPSEDVRISRHMYGYFAEFIEQRHVDRIEPTLKTLRPFLERYCLECKVIKPDRCHHCSFCEKCTLKMDHHCPWVGNCVGFSNYKFFWLFLLYAHLLTIYAFFTNLPYLLKYANDDLKINGSIHVVILAIITAAFGFGVMSLFYMHLKFVLANQTTLESSRFPHFKSKLRKKNGFDLGMKQNFIQVFGTNPLLWPFPIYTTIGDGADFPICEVADEELGSEEELVSQ